MEHREVQTLSDFQKIANELRSSKHESRFKGVLFQGHVLLYSSARHQPARASIFRGTTFAWIPTEPSSGLPWPSWARETPCPSPRTRRCRPRTSTRRQRDSYTWLCFTSWRHNRTCQVEIEYQSFMIHCFSESANCRPRSLTIATTA